ncbi:hypothetical protein CCH79_00020940, partial [Gambusia affinis]
NQVYWTISQKGSITCFIQTLSAPLKVHSPRHAAPHFCLVLLGEWDFHPQMGDNDEDDDDSNDADEAVVSPGCKECCERCVGSLPWASLIATILLYMGVALFCGCGHEALSGTVNILQNYFEVIRAPGDVLDVFTIIDILKYIIYGLAAGFFVFGVLLLVEGFFTTGAIRDLYGEFKITACGRCLTAFLMVLAYLFFLVWLGVTAFTSLPVFMYYNVWSMCKNATSVEGANLCLDLRQF